MRLESIIIHEDNDLVAINKPSGLLTIPDREGKDVSLKQMLKEKYGNIFTVHRIDRETSGIVVFAKNETMHQHLSVQFEKRETKKIYNGLVLGSPAEKSGTIDQPISEHPSKKGVMTVYKKGKESITEFEVLEDYRVYTWMQFRILTGRTHQIRVHMKHIGHPIACDPVYGDAKPVFMSSLKQHYKLSQAEDEERPLLNRLALHALSLSFNGPDGKVYQIEAPVPKDLRATLNQLTKRRK
jgi:23S rRNA pseudouridine955/2504/2580 synthase/23S rRNA pseudouridine1911/1915/1917 synthase